MGRDETMIKVCISGYYGCGIAADELTLLSLIESLRNHIEDVEIVVFSDDPEETAAAYGVIAYDRSRWSQLHKGILESDIVICGDSSLMREKTDFRSYYEYTRVIRMAVRRKKPVFVYGQGFRSLESGLGRKLIVNALRKVSRVTVRDKDSAECLRDWGMRRGRISITADPLLNLTSISHCWDLDKYVAMSEKIQQESLKKEEEEVSASADSAVEVNQNDDMELQIVVMDPEAFASLEKEAKKESDADGLDDIDIPMEQFATVVPEGLLPKDEEPLVAADARFTVDTPMEIEIIITEPEHESTEETVVQTAADDEETVQKEDLSLQNEISCSHRLLNETPWQWALEDSKLAVFFLSESEHIPVGDLVSLADDSVRFGYTVVFVPFQYERDLKISKDVLSQMTEFAEIFDIGDSLLPQELMDIISAADLVIGMNLPVLTMAALRYKPFAAISGEEGISSFCHNVGVPLCGNSEQYDSDAFFANYRKLVGDTDAVVAALEANLPNLCEEANQINFLLDVIVQRVIRKSDHVKRTRAEKMALLEERKAARAATGTENSVDVSVDAANLFSEQDDDEMEVSIFSMEADVEETTEKELSSEEA